MIGQAAGDLRRAVFGDVMHEAANGRNFARIAGVLRRADKAVRIFLGDKGGGDVPPFKAVMLIHGLQERDIMPDAVQFEIIQRRFHRLYRNAAVLAPCAELGDHRVIEHGNLAAFKDARIIANNRALFRGALRWRAVAH